MKPRLIVISLAWLAACDPSLPESVAVVDRAVAGEDGLAEAHAVFAKNFTGADFWSVGFGYHPGISTTRIEVDGQPVTGSASFEFATGRVRATLIGAPAGTELDLWLVKNAPGGTVRPEAGDPMVHVGPFQPDSGQLVCDVIVAPEVVGFDLDQVVVSRRGHTPADDVVATGARSLLEKRFFRARAGLPMDPVSGETLLSVETSDPLVARGAFLFFHETFGGNGRTCGTCHRAEENLTINAAFIATLPPDDPLFVAEQVPALAELENSALLRHDALIKENVDGFGDVNRFVLRGVPHTLGTSTSMGTGELAQQVPFARPPDFRLGWGGDGAPGRGGLAEFSFGAIVQHFPQRLDRVAGVDFRVPTQEELEALEAFMLFSGRQRNPIAVSLTFREARAESGKALFQQQAQCVLCHRDLVGGSVNFLVDTDVERMLIAAPRDGGFGVTGTDRQGGTGNGHFNVPPLVEAADTAPYFHNNVIQTLEEAVAFYTTDVFFFSPARQFTGPIVLTQAQIDDVGAFLRVVNAGENLRQTRKRVTFVRDHRSAGNDDLLRVALADLTDAIEVLEAKSLNPTGVFALKVARQTLEIGLANADADRPAFCANALVWLNEARKDLFLANPLDEL